MKNKFLVGVLTMITGWICQTPMQAQYEPEQIKPLIDKYKNEKAIYAGDHMTYIIKPDGDKLKITCETEETILFLTDKAAAYAQNEISYVEYHTKIKNIDAYTLVPKENGTYKKVKVTDISESKNTSERVFFDDVHTKSLTFPEPTKYGLAVMKYTSEITDPHFIGKYFFGSGLPVAHSSFTVKVHESVDYKYVMINPVSWIKFTETKEGKFKVYKWQADYIDKVPYEEEAKPGSFSMPHLINRIASWNLKDKTVDILPDTRGLFKYTYGLLEKGLEPPDAAIKYITDSVLNGIRGDDQKVQAIYNYIQENIKYIAFEDGMGGFIPRKPSLVCSRKFGDCKDLSNLLVTMLNYAGLQAYHTWIGTHSLPYKFSEVPAMGVANHMICALWLHNRWYFLDGTARYLNFKYPSDFVQGKQAMIGISKDSFVLADIPIVEATENYTHDSIVIEIHGDSITGEGYRRIGGLVKSDIVSSYYYTQQSNLKEFWESHMQVGQDNCKISEYEIKGIADRDSALYIKYKFIVPGYITMVDHEKYINLNVAKLWNNSEFDTLTRTRAYQFDKTKSNEIITVLKVPAGYQIQQIPADKSLTLPAFGFDFKYTKIGQNLMYRQHYYFNSLELNKADFGPWNQLMDHLHRAYRQNILLTQTKQK